MKAAALRDLLAAMADDTVVTINGKHVEYVSRHHAGPHLAVLRRSRHECPDCGEMHEHRQIEHVAVPHRLDLGSRWSTPGPHAPEPAVDFYGRWTKAMRAAIDTHSEDPDAG